MARTEPTRDRILQYQASIGDATMRQREACDSIEKLRAGCEKDISGLGVSLSTDGDVVLRSSTGAVIIVNAAVAARLHGWLHRHVLGNGTPDTVEENEA